MRRQATTRISSLACMGSFLPILVLDTLDDPGLSALLTGGGRLRFVKGLEPGQLRITTTFDTPRDLDASERARLVAAVRMQWSDGLGSGAFSNQSGEVLSRALAMALINEEGRDAYIGDRFVDADPDIDGTDVTVTFHPDGSAAGEILRDLIEDARQGDTAAMVALAQSYEDGIDVDQDDSMAFALYQQAALAGHSFAMVKAAACLLEGLGCEKDPDAAFIYAETAAEHGVTHGLHIMGQCFAEGHGVEADPTKAVDLYAQGAEQGDVGCMAELGDCYEFGRGVTRDPQQALAYYEAAYDAGFEAVGAAIERVKAA
ncbi:MAG: tetratricopeptide repeat protein [Hyphomicrobiaceae bacterium]